MPIVTPEIYMTWANNHGIATSPNELASLAMLCPQMDQAIKNRLKRTIERQNFTGLILDAPDTPNILLHRYAPIVLVPNLSANPPEVAFQCSFNAWAQGNPDAFTSDHLYTIGTQYQLDRDPTDPTLSPGNLRRLGTVWGINYRRRPGQLAFQNQPNIGAIKLTFTAGYAVVPDAIIGAACTALSQVLGNRRYGYQVGSESWGGYSYNIPGVGLLMHGILGNPDILGPLEPYINHSATIG